MDLIRDKRQDEGINKWVNNKGRGAIVAPTGFGKTAIGAKVAKKYLDKNENRNVLIICPNVNTISQWAETLINKNVPPRFEIMSVHSYHSSYTSQNVKYTTDLVIFDEIDELYGEEGFKLINKEALNYTHVLGLTATYEDRHNRHQKIKPYLPIVDFITEKEAIANGWISQFIEYNIGIDLPSDNNTKWKVKVHNELTDEFSWEYYSDKEYYEYLSEQISKYMTKFGTYGLDLVTRVLSGGTDKKGNFVDGFKWATMWAIKNNWQKNLDINTVEGREIDSKWNPNIIIGYAKKVMLFIKKRKDFLYVHDSKIEAACQIVAKFDKLKTICFSESSEFATKLFEEINKRNGEICTLYHSMIESRPLVNPTTGEFYTYRTGNKKGQPKIFGAKKLKEFAINAIRDGDVRIISTVSSLDRGFDVRDIQLGIITSGNSSFQKQKQRGGRVKRLFKEDSIALIINVYFKDTKDYDWLRNRQSHNESKVYWVSIVNDVKFEPKDIGYIDINNLINDTLNEQKNKGN